MRTLLEEDLRNMAVGAAVLGCGGGGNPHLGFLIAREVLRKGYAIRLADPDELPAAAPVAAVFGIGAPTVGVEKVRAGTESVQALRALERYTGQRYEAIAPIEVGGSNSMLPLALGGLTGLPVLDLDGMGRAFPEVQMVTYGVYGISASPLALADERGNIRVLEALDDRWMEKMARALVVVQGGRADAVGFPSTVGQLRAAAIPNTMTLAEKIGQVIRGGADVWPRLLSLVHGQVVFYGKIGDVNRRTQAGFSTGEARLEGLGPFDGKVAMLSFQNENLALLVDGIPRVTVPDLITLMDAESGEPITTEVMRFGWRVRVLAMPCHGLWRTPAGLRTAGPAAFGYDYPYRPLTGM